MELMLLLRESDTTSREMGIKSNWKKEKVGGTCSVRDESTSEFSPSQSVPESDAWVSVSCFGAACVLGFLPD